MTDVVVTGAEQFRDLSRRLRKAGEKDLAKELGRAVREGSKPGQQAAKVGALGIPSRGTGRRNSRRRLARGVGVRVRTGSGVQVISRVPAELTGFARGMEKPVFRGGLQLGHPWFKPQIAKTAPAVREGLLSAMDTVAKKITSSS